MLKARGELQISVHCETCTAVLRFLCIVTQGLPVEATVWDMAEKQGWRKLVGVEDKTYCPTCVQEGAYASPMPR